MLLIANKKIVREILVIIALYAAVALVTASVLQSLAKSSYEDALFESVSALTTTGLTSGHNFSEFGFGKACAHHEHDHW